MPAIWTDGCASISRGLRIPKKELASRFQATELIDTKQPVIARLEDADCEDHSPSMLQRMAEALGQLLEASLVPATVTDG